MGDFFFDKDKDERCMMLGCLLEPLEPYVCPPEIRVARHGGYSLQ